jgi:hypothetical protein
MAPTKIAENIIRTIFNENKEEFTVDGNVNVIKDNFGTFLH